MNNQPSDRIFYLFGSTDHRGMRHSIFVKDGKTIYRIRAPRGEILSDTVISSEQINGIKNKLGQRDERPRDERPREEARS